MTIISELIDTQVVVYRRVEDGPAIGLRSKYANAPHPNTEKDIKGWLWDNRKWDSENGLNQYQVSPTLWDPSSVGIVDLVQAGIGDNNDLTVESVQAQEENGKSAWRPRVLHGYYYQEDGEFYLHSDDGVIEYVQRDSLVPSGGNRLQLNYNPKSGIPIVAAGYRWNRNEGYYEVDRIIRKRVNFTGKYTADEELPTQTNNTIFWENVNQALKEWQLDPTTSPPSAQFNQQIVELVGPSVPATLSGLSQVELDELDTLGVTTGVANEQFRLEYSPVDPTSDIGIYGEYLGSYKKFTTVSSFTDGNTDECIVDHDLGIVTFGNSVAGGIPTYGTSIRAAYYKTVGIEYEPSNSRDYITTVEADVNPIRRFVGNGFVHLRRKPQDISRLELSAVLPSLGTDFYGPLYVGNSFSTIECKVFSQDDELIEGAQITFEVLTPGGGEFGTSPTATAISNGLGVARTLFNPPRTIDELGGVTDLVTPSGLGSNLYIDGYIPAIENSSLSLFQVAKEDNILGIPKSGLKDYYEDYLQSETEMTVTLSGTGPGPAIDHELDPGGNYAWLGSAFERWIKWEVWHREVHGFATPMVYEYQKIGSASNDLRTGKKTVVAKLDLDAVNPHTGTTPALVAVQPDSFTTTASGVNVYFSDSLDEVTEDSPHRSYMVVGPTKVELRARALNVRTNRIVFSNTIEILIDISDSGRGLYQIDAINSVPSGLLTNAKFYDQEDVNLEATELTASGLLPLGWRLRSPGITLASALNGITFLDLQPLAQSYNNESEDTASGLRINTSHQVDVDI